MPRRARRAPRRRPNRKPRRKQGRRGGGRQQMARISETIEFSRLVPNTQLNCTFNLNMFERARTLATNFRWYKPTKVTWTLEPQYNVFQGGINSPTQPYVYTVMNRTQDSSAMTLSDFLSMGAKPVKLTGSKKISYRPNWCSPGLIVQNVVALVGQFGGALNNVYMNGLKAEYDWLQAPNNLPGSQTSPGNIVPITPGLVQANSPVQNIPSATLFNGHQYYVEQQIPPTSAGSLFKITCTVDWAFKDPKNILAQPGDNLFDISGADTVPDHLE